MNNFRCAELMPTLRFSFISKKWKKQNENVITTLAEDAAGLRRWRQQHHQNVVKRLVSREWWRNWKRSYCSFGRMPVFWNASCMLNPRTGPKFHHERKKSWCGTQCLVFAKHGFDTILFNVYVYIYIYQACHYISAYLYIYIYVNMCTYNI